MECKFYKLFGSWPDKYSKVKVKEKNCQTQNFPVVLPNLTNAHGMPIDYKMRILNYRNNINFSALPRAFRSSLEGSRDFSTPKYFGKFLSDYFTKVKAKGWELKYTRNLPMDVNTSAIESLICELYFDDEFNWVSLTTPEIVSTWLKKIRYN